MIVIYGWRTMGKVDAVDNQYALTKFFHVFWLPIVPYGSVWIVDHGTSSGHEIKLYGKSILAAYARWWGLIIGGLCVALAAQGDGIGWWITAGVMLGLAIWSATWGRMKDRTLSDANLAAFGTRCEPKLLQDSHAEELRGVTGRMWAEYADGKTPGDIARFGASDQRQATLAYAQLRLSALKQSGSAARDSELEARRIVESVRELPAADPYRSAPAVIAAVEDQVTAPALEREIAAPASRVPAQTLLADELAQRLVNQLTTELLVDKFTPRTIPKLGLAIDVILRRDGFFKSFVVVVLRAPDSYGGLGMGTPPIARAITDHVGGGSVVIIYVGSELGSRVERLESGLFKEEIAVRGVVVVDAADNRITKAMAPTSDTQPILDKIDRAIAKSLEPLPAAIAS